MTDLMQRLTAARPTEAELDTLWAPERRAATRARVLAPASARPRHPRRTAWLAAAAVTGAFVVVPQVVDGGAAAAEDLRQLAVAAAEQGGAPARGTFLHVTTEAVQRNSRLFGDGEVLDTNRERWIRWDGHTWAIDTRPSAGWTEHHVFERTTDVSVNNPTPEFAAALPDEPEALGAYLHENVSGSSSHEETMFVAVADLARSQMLPPETLSAALLVLADVDGVSTEDVAVEGRDAVEVTFEQWWGGLVGTQTVTFDRATGRILAERESDPGGSYESVTTMVEVVDEVPADVRADFERYDDGERTYG